MHFLTYSIGNGHLREAVIFLSEDAHSDEKTQPSRRSVRPPTRKRHLLAGVRVLRRENAIFSSDRASSVEKMSSSEQRRDAARPHWLIMQSAETLRDSTRRGTSPFRRRFLRARRTWSTLARRIRSHFWFVAGWLLRGDGVQHCGVNAGN